MKLPDIQQKDFLDGTRKVWYSLYMKTNTVSFKSSVLRSASYVASKRTLLVTFNSGAQYVYRGVPSDVAKEFVSAHSAGSYFSKYIKGTYESEQI